MSEWIKCSDRLPPIEQPVLLFDPSREWKHFEQSKIVVGWLEDEQYFGDGEYSFWPTHWMALPEWPVVDGKEIKDTPA